MAWELIGTDVMWYNDGTAVLGTLASAQVLWFVPATSAGTVTSTPDAAHWCPIELGGETDHVVLQWRSKVKDPGGLLNVTGPNWACSAVGQYYNESITDLTTPEAIAVDPETGHGTAASKQHGCDLTFITEDGVATSSSTNANAGIPIASMGGLFPLASPVVDETGCSINIHFGRRTMIAASANLAVPDGLYTSGLQKMWLAASTFQTMTGTLITTKLKGIIRILKFREFKPVRIVNDSMTVNKDRLVNL